MNAFAGFSFAPFRLEKQNTVHLVSSDVDAANMGGANNNVYSQLQQAYDAAVVIVNANPSFPFVAIKIYETRAADMGGLNLTSNFNNKVALVGMSPLVSNIGNIIGNNASGPGFSFTPYAIVNLTVGQIQTNSTGTTGNAGNITLNLINTSITSITASCTNALNNGGTTSAGTITINANSTTGFGRNSIIGTITASHAFATGTSGTLNVNGGTALKLGNVTLGSAITNGGGKINILECDTVGIIVSASTGQTHVLQNIKSFTSATFTGSSNITMSNSNSTGNVSVNTSNSSGSTVVNCNIGGTLSLVSTVGASTNIVENTTVSGAFTIQGAGLVNSTINNCLFKSTFTNGANNALGIDANQCIFTGNMVTVTPGSIFRNCSFLAQITGMADSLSNGIGCNFYNCSFTATGGVFAASSNLSIKCFQCSFVSFISSTTVAVISEREYQAILTTPGATTTALVTIPVPSGLRTRIIANVCGSSGTNAIMAIIANIFRNDAGTVTKIGASDAQIITPIADVALSAAIIACAVNTTNLVVNVTGIAATSIKWTGSFKVISSF